MPPLPKKRKKREADFGLRFRKYIETHHFRSGAFELKQCTSSLPFSAVKDHQIAALKKVKYGKLFWKIADDSRGVKPFDYFFLNHASAYVVIKYIGFFCMIDIDAFVMEKGASKRKSLTGKRAKEIASVVIHTSD